MKKEAQKRETDAQDTKGIAYCFAMMYMYP